MQIESKLPLNPSTVTRPQFIQSLYMSECEVSSVLISVTIKINIVWKIKWHNYLEPLWILNSLK